MNDNQPDHLPDIGKGDTCNCLKCREHESTEPYWSNWTAIITQERQQAAEEATRKERERCLECVSEGWGNMILTKEITSNVSQQISDEIYHIFTKSIYKIRTKIKNG